MTQPPTRWLDNADEAPSGFADAGAAYRAQGPSPEQAQRILVAAQAAQAASAAWWTSKWLWLGLGTLAVVGASFVNLAEPFPARTGLPAQVTVTTPAPRAVPMATPAVDAGAPGVVGGVGASETPLPAPRRAAAAKARARRATASDAGSDTGAAPLPAAPNAAQELALLKRARSLLATMPEQALALTQTHGAQFPEGMFAQERELLALQALIKLERRDEARARGEAFLRHNPKSVHAARIRALLAP